MEVAGLGVSRWFMAMFVCLASYYKKEGTFPKPTYIPEPAAFNSSYDFIIVGAGSAGSVLASRLSEVESWSVLLVEAGGSEDEISETPLLAVNMWNTDKDWNYTTTPQRVCQTSKDGCIYPRGRVIGGCSTMNFMNYVRGNKYDYDLWESQGNEGWGYKSVLPYFLKSEDIQIEELVKSKFHSTGGYLTIKRPSFRTPLKDLYAEAFKEMGYKKRDFNGAKQTGWDFPQFTLRGSSRCSAVKAFLGPAIKRPNINIMKRALVTKVILDKNRITKGIKVRRNGKEEIFRANKEVILSAGSFNSPKLLILSGIGPKDHLKDLNIPLVADLPVGKMLRDHCYANLVIKVNESLEITRKMVETSDSIIAYKNGSGPLTSPMGEEAVVHLSLKGDPEQDLPDLQFLINSYPLLRIKENVFSIDVSKLRPLSIGTLRLQSSDPLRPPIIDPNFLDRDEDFQDMVSGCKIALQIPRSKAFQKYSAEVYRKDNVCAKYIDDDNEFCKCVVKYNSGSFLHASGTARMGSSLTDSVVNSRLQVHTVTGLRVVDASVMPNIPSGCTHAPTMMIAEKAADFIKQFYNISIHK